MDKRCQTQDCDRVAARGNRFCDHCRREKNKTDVCKHYSEVERTVTVPWCSLKEKEILGLSRDMIDYYCKDCEDKEVE